MPPKILFLTHMFHRAIVIITANLIASDARARDKSLSITRRLVGLAVVFVPMSFISGLFSMQVDIKQVGGTMKWYFVTSIAFFSVCGLLLGTSHFVHTSAATATQYNLVLRTISQRHICLEP